LLPEIFAEEIRLAEEALMMELHLIDELFDPEDPDDEPII
jgi:hypothetical protein